MATNEDKELLLEWICLLVLGGFQLPLVFWWYIRVYVQLYSIDKTAQRISTWNCDWNGCVSYLLEVLRCRPSSVDILVCKCSSIPLIRWLRIRSWNFRWNGCVSYSVEAVHCHPSSVDNIGRKCSSSPLIRWLRIRTRNCCRWNRFVSHSF